MIKISHVMTIYTNKYVYVVYNFVLYVYIIIINNNNNNICYIYVLQAK